MNYRIQLNLIAILSNLAFLTAITFLNAALIRQNASILDKISQFKEPNELIAFAVLVIFLQILLFALNYLCFIANKIMCCVFYNKYTNLSLGKLFYGDSNQICRLNKSDIIFYSTDLSSEYVSTVVARWNSLLSTFIGLATYVFYFENSIPYQIILFIAIVYVFFYFITARLSGKISKYIGETIDIQAKLNTLTSEFIDNSESVRLAGIQSTVYNRLSRVMVSIKSINKRVVGLNTVLSIVKLLPQIIVNLIMFVYIYSSIRSGASIEVYFLTTPIVASYVSFFDSLFSLRSRRIKQCEQEKRLLPFLSMPCEEKKTEECHQNLVSLMTSNITYSYTDGTNLLSYPDCTVYRPNIVFVHGASGCGKTTFIRVLSGLLKPYSGIIEIFDDQNNKLIPSQCEKNFGYNPQMSYLFNGTVRENVTLGQNYSDESIIEALEKACAYDFIREKTRGLDTIIGFGGEGLSGGEKQRIALARALIRKPEILFLDECFSSLDNMTAKKIFENLAMENILCFIISHRDDFIDDLDKIKVINLNKT